MENEHESVVAPKPFVKPYLKVVCALFKRQSNASGYEQILIGLRPEKALGGGFYELPGGKVELGETLEEALRREITEELDVESEVKEKLWSDVIEYPDSICEVHLFRCEILSGKPKNLVTDELLWVRPCDLYRYNLLEGVKRAMRRIYPTETTLLRVAPSIQVTV